MFYKEQFTTVTPLSKALAMVVFIILPFAAFFLGMNFGRQTLPPAETDIIISTDNSDVQPEPEEQMEAIKEVTETTTPPPPPVSPPKLRVVSPNGGENFCIGEPIQIDWEASSEIEIVNLYVDVPGVQSTIGSFPAKDGVAFWTPTKGHESQVSRIRIFGRPGGGEGIDDFSDSIFRVILCEG